MYALEKMSGICVTEISFDINHEQEYILPGLENKKCRNGMLFLNAQLLIWNILLMCYALYIKRLRQQ